MTHPRWTRVLVCGGRGYGEVPSGVTSLAPAGLRTSGRSQEGCGPLSNVRDGGRTAARPAPSATSA